VSLGCYIASVLDQKPFEVHWQVTPFGRPTEWSSPLLVLGCHVGPVFDQEPWELQVNP